jgi:Transcriptional regulator/sugar kinase
MKNIVIDMGGTRVKLALLEGNKIVSQTVITAHSQEGGILKTLSGIEEAIIKMMDGESISSIDSIGFSLPGIIDTKNKKILSINDKYVDGVGFDFSGWAEKMFNATLYMENDARAALLGEWQCGAGKGIDNIVMMTLGTGIGGAAFIEGRLLHGKHFQAGCLGGHFTIDFRGEMCNCGNKGCAESIASSWGLPRLAEKMGFLRENVEYKMLFDAMNEGDTAAKEILDICIEAWSACAVNLIHAYDPEILIIGGGVMNSADHILPKIEESVNKYSWTPWGKVKVEKSASGDAAALYGMNCICTGIYKI